jgi:hypothetical protein
MFKWFKSLWKSIFGGGDVKVTTPTTAVILNSDGIKEIQVNTPAQFGNVKIEQTK